MFTLSNAERDVLMVENYVIIHMSRAKRPLKSLPC